MSHELHLQILGSFDLLRGEFLLLRMSKLFVFVLILGVYERLHRSFLDHTLRLLPPSTAARVKDAVADPDEAPDAVEEIKNDLDGMISLVNYVNVCFTRAKWYICLAVQCRVFSATMSSNIIIWGCIVIGAL